MRFFRTLIVLAAACLLGSFAPAPARAGTTPSIRVQAGDWGEASIRDIKAVLDSVADVLLPEFPAHASVRIVVGFSETGPRVLAKKAPEGAHQVFLNVQGRRWDQYAYQFSHELCHIVSNYDYREIGEAPASRSHQWFEETLCEAVSLVALNRLAMSWRASPPFPGWENYAPAFREYAQRLLNDEHRHLLHAQSLALWYEENRRSLESNPYLRKQNELGATALFALFEAVPGSLQAIGYLNREPPSQESFAAYLVSWYECCPESHRPFVLRLMSLFTQA